jgi:riboflavin transporter FmnP
MQNNPRKLVTMAMLAALSIVLLLIIRLPIFLVVPWLVYEPADVPILIGAFMFGPISGFAILIVVAVIQAFLLSPDGWVGLVMHLFASGALVLVAGYIYKIKTNKITAIIGLLSGCIAMTAIMIPLNLYIDVKFYGMPLKTVQGLMPYIISFNIIKSSVNSIIVFIVYNLIQVIIKRTHLRNINK